MKTIVLFHRCELTDLFAPVGVALDGKVRIVHLAYSEDEADRLRALGITQPITIFKEEVRRLYPTCVADADTLKTIDDLFIQQSGGAFNLNGAIQSDRGFIHLSLDEAHRLTVAYHRFWSEFLDLHGANIVLHETCSLMFNFVAAMACAERGGYYLYCIEAHGPNKEFYHLVMSGFDFNCPDLDNALLSIETQQLEVNEDLCANYLSGFRKSFSVFFGVAFKRSTLLRLLAGVIVKRARQLLSGKEYDRILDNIDYWAAERRTAEVKLLNLLRYRKYIRFDSFDRSQRYYFYPLHLEPEAVVLYHAHGLYTNQIKLIQNIAAQMPPGVLLYVKDHPHDHGYRAADDYLVLKSIPNVRLLDSAISGKEVIAHSIGVITQTGTPGFEALLLGKQVFTFGKTFYSSAPGVVYVRNIRDLRELLYSAAERPPLIDAVLYRYLMAYFTAIHHGMTDYFAGHAQRYGIDLDQNARVVAAGLLVTIQTLK